MRVLITGIDGFVGSHAADMLVKLGVEVHGTVFAPDHCPNIAHIQHQLTLHHADVTDRELVSALVRRIQPDRILHIAGQAFVPASLRDPMTTFQVNLIGGLSVLEAARELKASGHSPAVLIVSSGEVYGKIQPHQLPLTENEPLVPNTPYAASKAGLDLIAQQYAQCFGVNVIIVRPFNHAGPRQNASFVVADFAKQFAEITLKQRDAVIRVGNIDVQRDFTDVRDVVRAYWQLFERHSSDFVFNVGSNRPMEIRDLLHHLQRIAAVTPRIEQEAQRVRSYDVPIIAASYQRLHAATGWTPQIPFEQTLRDTYAYWLDLLKKEH